MLCSISLPPFSVLTRGPLCLPAVLCPLGGLPAPGPLSSPVRYSPLPALSSPFAGSLESVSLPLACFCILGPLFASLALPTSHHFSCCPFFSAHTLPAGGNGYINDFPMGRFLRDAKLYEIGAGTSEVRRLVIGRAFNTDFH